MKIMYKLSHYCKLSTLSFLIITSAICLPLSGQDLYDEGHTESFAKFLFQSRQYDLAAREYERLLILQPEKGPQKELFQSYRLAGQYAFGIQRYHSVYDNPEQYSKVNFLELTKLQLAGGQFEDFTRSLQTQQVLQSDETKIIGGIRRVYDPTFKERYQAVTLDESDHPILIRVQDVLVDYEKVRLKNPTMAALMSAVVPGSGRLYSGDWQNAIISFLFVGINGWQSYRSFNRGGIQSAGGWIFGAIGLGFYTGNIYGSALSAKRKNKQKRDEFKHKVEYYYFNY
jgi:hypothetical protein